MVKLSIIHKSFSCFDHLPDILKIEDIAQFLRVSKRTVYNWIEFGELPAYRFGLGKKGCIRVFKEDFLKFIRSRKEVL